MWDGFERFLKTQEVGGDLHLDLREFKTTAESKMKELFDLVNKRVTAEYFQLTVKRNDKKIKELIDKKFSELEVRCRNVQEFCQVSSDELKNEQIKF